MQDEDPRTFVKALLAVGMVVLKVLLWVVCLAAVIAFMVTEPL